MEYQTIKGEKIPSLGLGTYRLTGEDCTWAVERALSMGYRHVDTAQMYGNEDEVGLGIKNAGVKREDIFLVTKVWPSDFARERMLQTTHESLSKLGTDYVDLLLMHWPSERVPMSETLKAMNELRDEGSVRHIGVSNFSTSQVQEASQYTEVFCNQVQYHVNNPQDALLEQAREMDYLITAYRPLSRGSVQSDSILREIGEAHDKTASKVALRWLIQQEKVCAIPKATSEEHLEANFDIFDFELSDEEMERISLSQR